MNSTHRPLLGKADCRENAVRRVLAYLLLYYARWIVYTSSDRITSQLANSEKPEASAKRTDETLSGWQRY